MSGEERADTPKKTPTTNPIPATAIPIDSASWTASAPGRNPGSIPTDMMSTETVVIRQGTPTSHRRRSAAAP
jgi:hypothetical protein